ncbi:hypothetical protein MIND_00357300 [Mycena indigotica]|uniref:Fruit-body specific protein a n=1 Tax=Mycena indigotica TaxID=2126181 RepID=A0A8H6T4Q1_9AGAR|nr:uncharacterized protein MIND_00357300 [Mycena indigotica]KAF7309852.1 hypothetical protein MIND_00357300 [Mycena indigotica]
MLPRLALFVASAVLASAQFTLPPALQAAQDSATSIVVSEPVTTYTNVSSIANMVSIVDQKGGAPSDSTRPGLPQQATKLTALDGKLVDATVPTINLELGGAQRREAVDYEQVFSGSKSGEPDAAIEGTAYLTYFLVSNSTYQLGLDECLAHCDETLGCAFVNLYYELNNPYLDFVFPEKSNLKCVLYGDVHNEEEKTDLGNELLPSIRTVIQQSSGYALQSLRKPADPAGYKLVFGPLSAANNAPQYMGFAFLDKYDVKACAALCNTRGADSNDGACKFFNIWRAVVNGKPATYTCAMYSAPTDASTATNTGQGDLQVTRSRGYVRINHIVDGTFEAYVCDDGDIFCFTEEAAGWVGSSPAGGQDDATIFHYAPYAHHGSSVALLGSAFGSDAYPGLLQPAWPITGLRHGRTYVLGFFHSSSYSGEELESDSFVTVWWGRSLVGNITVGYSTWAYYEFKVVAGRNNTLSFIGGQAPAYDFIDDVSLFLLY